MIDPWDGKEKPTSSYKVIGCAIIEKLGNAQEGETMEIDKATFEKLVVNSTKFDEFVKAGYQNAQQVIDEKAKLDKKISDYAKTIEDQDKTIFSQKEDIRNLESELATCQAQVENPPGLEEDFELNGRTITSFLYDEEGQKIKEIKENFKIIERQL